ncbi:MAG TPA: NADP-dependent oxidoreductase [Steroidobacteraceae bacterium]|jgi:NADPH2:quinone reductase
MRAMVFDRYGEPDVMRLRDVPIPEPQTGEVLIRVSHAGVNPADSKARAGHSARAGYRYREVAFPFVTGMDASGVVERTGASVSEFKQGDRVITWSNADGKTWGSYAEFIRVSARNVSRMPKSLNFAQAAAVPIASLTAFQALFHAEKGGMIPGQKVLIHGAAGGVGSFAMQFAKSGGLLAAATCGTPNVAYVRSLGADRVIDYRTEDVCRAVRDWSAEGVDVVLDAVGPATLPQALTMLRSGGRLINILTVTADGDIERDRKEAERGGFRKITTIIDFERARDSMREITHLIDGGLVHLAAVEVLPLEEAPRAHQLIDTGHVRGKLVLKVAEI